MGLKKGPKLLALSHMIRVGITGGDEFKGLHLRFFLCKHKQDYECILIEKDDFSDEKKLAEKMAGCDVVVHIAGINRGEEDEIYKTNTDLTKKMLAGLDRVKKKPKIIFSSSTHNTKDTAYGRSKKDSENMIAEWGKKNKAPTTSIVAPNTFGEFSRPYYSSAIATFCHELSEGEPSKVNESASMRLVYVGDICSLIFNFINSENCPITYNVAGTEVKVGEVYNLLKNFQEKYLLGTVPVFKDRFELDLFNTLRSFLYPKHCPVSLDLKTDNRGSLFEVIKEKTGGQTFFSTTHVGMIRGNHYHTRKIERFCVVKGNANIRVRRLLSEEILEYKVSGDKPVYVDMPTYHTHSIENTGPEELLTMFWSNEIFDPTDPDTFPEPVIIS